MLRKTESRYIVDVVIREKKVPSFCDTGADVCIMSRKNAKRVGFKILPTAMRVRPFGSRAMRYIGEATNTVRHGAKVANTRFYIMGKKVETLLSGTVCEELGIITLNKDVVNEVRRTPGISEPKS